MYCSIRNYSSIKDNFNFDVSHIKEITHDFNYDILEMLENTKNETFRHIISLCDMELTEEVLEILEDLNIIRDVVFKISNINHINLLNDRKLKFFLDSKTLTIRNLDSLSKVKGLSELITDVYIGGEAAFKMSEVKIIADSLGIKIRVIPNVCERIFSLTENANCCFWIRPEDLSLYRDYVDVIEFFGDKQHLLYKIYFLDKEWIGDLGTIITNLFEEIPNVKIGPTFGERRLNCGKTCSFNKCHKCDYIINLAKMEE